MKKLTIRASQSMWRAPEKTEKTDNSGKPVQAGATEKPKKKMQGATEKLKKLKKLTTRESQSRWRATEKTEKPDNSQVEKTETEKPDNSGKPAQAEGNSDKPVQTDNSDKTVGQSK